MITKNRAKCKSALPITPRPKGFKKIPLRCKAYNQNPSTKNGQINFGTFTKISIPRQTVHCKNPSVRYPKSKNGNPKRLPFVSIHQLSDWWHRWKEMARNLSTSHQCTVRFPTTRAVDFLQGLIPRAKCFTYPVSEVFLAMVTF